MIEQRLLKLLATFHGMLPARELEEMNKLASAGEPGVCLENLCTQIYEYDVPVGADTLNEVRSLGASMGINPKYWERLGS